MNQNTDFMTNKLTGAHAKVGHVTEIAIKPTEQVTSDPFRNLPENKRKCRLSHELHNDKSFFTTYSQLSCEYMCMIRNMSKTQPCIPWDQPNLNSMVICHGRQTFGFVTAQEQYIPSEDPNCNCPPDCEKISFGFESSSSPLDIVKDCNAKATHGEYMDTPYSRKMFKSIRGRILLLASYIRRSYFNDLRNKMPKINERYAKLFHEVTLFRRLNESQLCIDHSRENNAYIIMYVKEPTMIQLIKDVKLTFADKLGIFGGTIGVFTGISFITMIEIAYWIIIAMIEKLNFAKKSPTHISHSREHQKSTTPVKIIDITPVETNPT